MFALVGGVLAGAACTHRHRATSIPSALRGERVMVHTRDGVSFAGHIEGTSPVLRRDDGTLIPVANVSQVSTEYTARGAGEGCVLGLLTGATFGVVVGLVKGDDPPCDYGTPICVRFAAKEKAAFGGIVFGGLGAVVGLVIGAVVGSSEVFDFDTASDTGFRPVGPPGSIAGASWSF